MSRVLTEIGECHALANIRWRFRAGVQVAIAGGMLTAKGKLGELKLPLTDHVEAKVDGNHVVGRAAHRRARRRA